MSITSGDIHKSRLQEFRPASLAFHGCDYDTGADAISHERFVAFSLNANHHQRSLLNNPH